MDLKNSKYVIMELIPTSINSKKGEVVQISALKLDGLKLIDRFDYRLNEKNIYLKDLVEMLNYDKDSFTYKETSSEIMDDFKEFVKDLNILYIDNSSTSNYIKDLTNNKESVFNYLNEKYSDDIIDKIIDKYSLVPSNYIVDLLYESLIHELN